MYLLIIRVFYSSPVTQSVYDVEFNILLKILQANSQVLNVKVTRLNS